MSNTDNYFTFPLAILHGNKPENTPLDCLDLALNCGILNAGIGYRKINSQEDFDDRLAEAIEEHDIKWKLPTHSQQAEVLIGAGLCGVKLANTSPSHLNRIADAAGTVKSGGPFVKMASAYLWPAIYQARAEADPTNPKPERGISWREFRILCAILSMKTNRANFSFVGWETIQARSCGFTTKAAFRSADIIPDHLAPSLTHKQIRTTCDTLENLGFFARFRFSLGPRGGKMAYSIRHTRDELAQAVCESANFADRAKIKANRESDAKKCLELLERAKSGQCLDKGGA